MGAVPILTMNMQVCGDGTAGCVADAWHHQAVYGVDDSDIVHLTNGDRIIPRWAIEAMLTAPSVLLVKTQDVLRWYTDGEDLNAVNKDGRWRLNQVVQQVQAVVAQRNSGVTVTEASEMHVMSRGSSKPITHISIPACYTAGITVLAAKGTAAFDVVARCGDAPAWEAVFPAK